MGKKLPTAKQVTKEAEALEKIKPTVRRTSIFGENHHDAIEAQISVLREDLTDDDIYDRYEDTDNVLSAAQSARAWLDGDREEEESLSDEWQSLVIKGAK